MATKKDIQNLDANQSFLIEKSQVILDEIKKSSSSPVKGEVFASHNSELKVVFEHKDFSISTNHTNSMFGIRVIVDGCLGFITTNSVTDELLRASAREALEVARLSPPSEFHQISESKLSQKIHAELFDSDLANMPIKDVFESAQQVVDIALTDKRVSIDRAEFSLANSAWSIMNTNGVASSSRQAMANWYVMGMGKENDEVTSFDFDGGSVAFLKDVGRNINESIVRFRDGVVQTLHPKNGRSYKGPVLLHPQAVYDLLTEHVEFHCNGRVHQDKMSSWQDKVGQVVTVEDLNIFEDPLDMTRPEGWSPFDREGVSTQKHFLIKDGVLNFLAHNCFSAKRGGCEPTGNASGGARALPAIGFHNITVSGSKGVLSDNELFKKINNGLLIKRFSGNTDPTSGVFSGIAKNSGWVADGEYTYPVQEVMLAGNMFDVLKNIVAIGSTLHPLLGGGRAPYVVVDGLSVTAGT